MILHSLSHIDMLTLPSVLPTYTSSKCIRVSPILAKFIVPYYYGRTQCNLRSEPSSRTALTGEQPDPWELISCCPLLLEVSDYTFTRFLTEVWVLAVLWSYGTILAFLPQSLREINYFKENRLTFPTVTPNINVVHEYQRSSKLMFRALPFWSSLLPQGFP